MNIFYRSVLFISVLIAAAHLAAAMEGPVITGSVRNQTTGQPVAGDDVILLQTDMQEAAQTTTDEQGNFMLRTPAGKGPYLVRVRHQGVSYDRQAMAGDTATVDVFDVVTRVAGVSGGAGIIQLEADLTTLHVREMYAIENDSHPPRTQQNAGNFEINLPQQAVIDSVSVAGQGALATTVPAQMVRKGLYRIDFPLRPGETRYVVTYHLPYKGAVSFRPKISYGIGRFAVMVPQSMNFKAARRDSFHVAQNPENGPVMNGAQIQVANQPVTGAAPEFEISGAGALPPLADLAHSAHPPAAPAPPLPASPMPPQARQDAGPSHDAQKRSGSTSWLLPVCIAIALIAGLLWAGSKFTRKRQTGGREEQNLEGLKEKLFQLESDRLRGAVSEAEYAAARQALSKSIARAMKSSPSAVPEDKPY
jgi:hypothetical protein